jgi:hypothetical protein
MLIRLAPTEAIGNATVPTLGNKALAMRAPHC